MAHGTPAISADSILSRNPKVTYRDLEEGGVLLHLETGAYHGLNVIGSRLWQMLDRNRTVEDLLRELHERLEDPPSTVDAEVTEFLGGMVERDLLHLTRP